MEAVRLLQEWMFGIVGCGSKSVVRGHVLIKCFLLNCVLNRLVNANARNAVKIKIKIVHESGRPRFFGAVLGVAGAPSR